MIIHHNLLCIVMICHKLSCAIRNHHELSRIVKSCQELSRSVKKIYNSSLIVNNCHELPSIVINCHTLSGYFKIFGELSCLILYCHESEFVVLNFQYLFSMNSHDFSCNIFHEKNNFQPFQNGHFCKVSQLKFNIFFKTWERFCFKYIYILVVNLPGSNPKCRECILFWAIRN